MARTVVWEWSQFVSGLTGVKCHQVQHWWITRTVYADGFTFNDIKLDSEVGEGIGVISVLKTRWFSCDNAKWQSDGPEVPGVKLFLIWQRETRETSNVLRANPPTPVTAPRMFVRIIFRFECLYWQIITTWTIMTYL